MLDVLPYWEIVLVDFEFIARPGERPEPVCLVAQLLRAGRTIRLWCDELRPGAALPGRCRYTVRRVLRLR